MNRQLYFIENMEHKMARIQRFFSSWAVSGIIAINMLAIASFADAGPIVLHSVEIEVTGEETLVLPDLDGDGVAELGLAYLSTSDNKVNLQIVSGSDLSIIRLISWNNIYNSTSFHLLPDLNGNGTAEIGVFGTRNDGANAGKAQLFARDLMSGGMARVFNWPSNWQFAKAIVLDDISGDGIIEIALQGRFKEGDRPQLVVRSGVDNSSVRTYSYPDLFNDPTYYQHSDSNGDGIPEIATLGRIKRNNKIQVKIADGTNSNNRLKAYNFPDKWSDISWVNVGDKNGDSIDDWGLFGINKLDNRPQLIVKDGKNPVGAIRIFAWSEDLSSPLFYQIPDMNGDGVDDVAVGGLRSNGRYQFQVKDGADRNKSLANHNLSLDLKDVTFHVLSDLTGDGIAEIGFLGLNSANQFTLIVQNGDPQNTESENKTAIEYLFRDAWVAVPDLTILDDINSNGLAELLVSGNRSADSKMQILSIPDSDNDSYADTLDAFPSDDTEWLDTDKDDIGNNTDEDDDGDGIDDVADGFPLIPIGDFTDTDMDGIPDDCNSQCQLIGMQADKDDNGNGIPDDEELPPEVLVVITSPQSLVTVGVSPVTVEGTVSPLNATLVVNGVEVVTQDGQFSVDVTLQEGANTVEARASFASLVLTDSITIALDKTPPNVTVDSHTNGQVVYSENVTITGLINDIVRGSIGAEDANVAVNDVTAVVSNRSYAADIALTEGVNTIEVVGTDNVGNIETTTLELIYEKSVGKSIAVSQGQSQSAEIGTMLNDDLMIKVVDENEEPLENVSVVFRVTQGDGALVDGDTSKRAVVVKTDSTGQAKATFKVGTRVGEKNQKVKASVVGIDANVVFTASTESAMASKISINTGNNQRGSVAQRLASPLVVYVTDDGANPVEGATVKFKVLSGGGYFTDEVSEISVTTTSDGFASAEYWLGETPGIDAQRIEAMLESSSDEGLSSEFSATAYVPADPGNTSLSGLVLDTEANPLVGVTVLIEGTSREAKTNQTGYFNITETPVGAVHLLVDGSTIENADGDYPTLGFSPILVAGIENTLQQPIYMVKLSDTNRALASETEDAVVTMEDFPGYKLEIAANSATFPNGTKEGIVSISAVNSNRVPMAPPNGMQPQLAVTIQPSGTMFSPPAKITIPNLDGMEPGRQIDMYSFDHDLNEFVSIGLGTVSEDGALIESNPGIGILKAGWYIVPQPPSGDGDVEGDPDASNNPPDNTPEECGRFDLICQARQGAQNLADRVNDFIDDVTSCDAGEICEYIADSAQDFAESVGDAIDDAKDKVADGIDDLIEGGTELANEAFDELGEASDFVQDQAQRALDPIIVATGELEFTQTDMRIPGRGFDFELKRTYRSRLHFNGRVGYNWVFNYYQLLDIPQAGESNQNILRSMESGLQYTYVANEDGSYSSPNSIFDVLRKNTDGTFTIRRSDGFKTNFDADGRMDSQVDRYGNTMSFQYDDAERLVLVIDTLGREIVFSYRSDSGHIETVTDFSGRSVRYYYNEDRDLIAARTPVVTGTPNANDFVNGKFTQYTYSSGFDETDDILKHANHNLLSVTDAQGNVYLRNVYVNDPESYQFDKIIEQQYGEESQIFTVTYEELNVGEELTANLPRNLTTVVDRNDNLIEYTHNYGGMLLEERHFTNRDVNEDDPDVFVTSHQYNDDGLLLSKILPAGNAINYVYDSANPLRNMQRNLLSSTVTPGDRGATHATLTEQFTYEPVYTLVASTTNRRGFSTAYTFDYQHEDNVTALANELGMSSAQIESLLSEQGIDLEGGVAGQISGNVVQESRPTATLINDEQQVVTLERSYNRFGQLVEEIDAEGLVTQIEYYPENNPDGDGNTSDSTRTLASNDGGYKKSIKLDAKTTDKRSRAGNALQITSSYAYDQVGNVIAETDARGNTTRFIRNQLNQVVRKIAPEPFEYLTDYYYDANNNLVRISQQNIGTTSAALSGWVHTVYGYDSLNDKISETQIPEQDVYLTTSYEYDGNQNLIAIQQPEGNRVERVYDERDLVYTLTRGADTDDASTRTFSYDGNGNLMRQLDAQNNTGDENNDVTTFTYDGYDRLIQSIDAEDNRKTYQYDSNNNIVLERHYGNSGITGIDNQILLSENTTSYDELDRPLQRDDSLLVNGLAKNVDAGLTPDDSKVTVTNLYDANNQVLAVTDDNGNITEYVYDGLNRPISVTDANGNITSTQYDANSNVIQVSVVQVNVDELVATKTIQSVASYDELNRRITSTDALDNTTEYRYDARNNVVLVTDPLDNLTLHIYDGLNRLVQTREYLAVAGTGEASLDTTNPSNPDGIISTFYGYDSNSRLVFLADDKGNPTTYSFDALNRQTQITYADATTNTFVYDKDDNLITVTDQNGSVLSHGYDGLNRLVATNATKASGVVGSTEWTYSYDGLSRRILATDNNDPDVDSDDASVEYRYNSFNYLLSETNKGLTTTATYDGLGNQQTLNYPGGRSLQNTFDNIYNLKSIKDADADANLVEYDYAANRVLNRRYTNGSQLSYVTEITDSGYDAINRVLTHRHVDSEGSLLSGFEYAYDKANNRRYEVDQFSQLADVYEYDSSYRLIRAAYQIDAANDTLQLVANNDNTNVDVAPIIADEDESYMLDGVGNWISVQTQNGNDSDAVGYQLNEMNEYTRIGANDQTHDNNGNLTNDGSRQYLFDARNRLVRVTTLGGNTVASYKYDAFGRRIVKRAGAQTINYTHFGKQVIEERNAFSQMLRQYVYGNSVDEVIQLRNAANEDYFYHDNSIGSITAITDTSGQVVERYRYNAYGNTTILSADNITELTASSIGNTYAYTGRRLDAETGLYYYRARYYSPAQGRFIQRDPLGYADGMGVYTYVGNNPINYVDPDGLLAKEAGAWAKENSESLLDVTQNVLGLGSLSEVPLVSQGAGVIDAIISAARGDFVGAGLAIAGVAPGLGAAADIANQARKADRIRKNVAASKKARDASKFLDFAKRTKHLEVSRIPKGPDKIVHIGKVDDLKNVPRSQTILDELPDLGSPKANWKQNSSVLRRKVREGYDIRDASKHRLNSSPDPTPMRPDRTVGQSFLGAERNLLDNLGVTPK